MNELESTPVQLAGRGFIYKPSGNYLPGEYQSLDNVDLSGDGTIINRRTMTFLGHHVVGNADPNWRKFIGTYKSAVLSAGQDRIHYVTPQGNTNTHVLDIAGIKAALPAIVGPVGTTTIADVLQIEGFWTYNDFNYLLLLHTHFSSDIPVSGQQYYMHNRLILLREPAVDVIGPGPLEGETIYRFDSSSSMVVINDKFDEKILAAGNPAGLYSGVNDWPSQYVKTHFIYKERAWIVTEDTVFASKATDPFVWAPPDGFFIKYPNQEIKTAVPLEDTIYVLLDSRIYVLSYDTDPNLDSINVLVSESIGAESGVAVGDTVYFVKDDSLYSLISNSVEKLMDLHIYEELTPDNTPTESYAPKLGWYQDALYLILQKISRGLTTSTNPYKGEQAKFQSVASYFYRISLETGTVSRVSMNESFKALDAAHDAKPCDLLFNTTEGILNQNLLWFGYQVINPFDSYLLGFINEDRVSKQFDFVDDIPLLGSLNLKRVAPKILVRVPDWSPDQLKYFIKKFRQVLVSADIAQPQDGSNSPAMAVRLYAGALLRAADTDVVTSNPVSTLNLNERTDVANNQIGYRVPLNQRAAVITIEFLRNAADITGTVTSDSRFEISDVRVLWTPTRRGPRDSASDKT